MRINALFSVDRTAFLGPCLLLRVHYRRRLVVYTWNCKQWGEKLLQVYGEVDRLRMIQVGGGC